MNLSSGGFPCSPAASYPSRFRLSQPWNCCCTWRKWIVSAVWTDVVMNYDFRRSRHFTKFTIHPWNPTLAFIWCSLFQFQNRFYCTGSTNHCRPKYLVAWFSPPQLPLFFSPSSLSPSSTFLSSLTLLLFLSRFSLFPSRHSSLPQVFLFILTTSKSRQHKNNQELRHKNDREQK